MTMSRQAQRDVRVIGDRVGKQCTCSYKQADNVGVVGIWGVNFR